MRGVCDPNNSDPSDSDESEQNRASSGALRIRHSACGEELIASSDGKSLARCSPEGVKPVIVFSGAFVRRLGKWLERGYRVQGARVSFILAWTRQGRDEADAAALADLLLGRPADP